MARDPDRLAALIDDALDQLAAAQATGERRLHELAALAAVLEGARPGTGRSLYDRLRRLPRLPFLPRPPPGP